MSLDAWDLIIEWWQTFQPDARSNVFRIESGLKKQQTPSTTLPLNVDPAVKGSLQTAACQYWVKGLANVCIHWNNWELSCDYDVSNSDFPTGYTLGTCDGLGRRHWCNRYSGPVDDDDKLLPTDPNKYVCILPCIEKSGSGRVIRHEDQGIVMVAWTPEEISGYNPDEDNVGQCDGKGLGRGVVGFKKEFIENLQQIPPICKHYRPHQMGFGAVDPRPFHGDPPSGIWKKGQTYIPRTQKELCDGSLADPLVIMGKRLPFAFQIYNLRSKFQKCGHWDDDYGAQFGFDDYGADPSYFQINVDKEATGYCKLYSSEASVQPFCEIEDNISGIPWVLQNIWSKHGSVVCNGAKPECPCYTGKWLFCTDRNMQEGMRISADQIFELRFWTSDWASQEEYDSFYEQKPGVTHDGFADVTTADIFTFTNWIKDSPEVVGDLTNPSDVRMKGKKHHMCMPAPPHMREYDPEDYCTITPVVYPRHDDYFGTTSTSEAAYPTLVREIETPSTFFPNLLVIYPYSTISPWDVVPCFSINNEDDYCYHNNNIMSGNPSISVVGSCVRNKTVLAINASHPDVGEHANKALYTMRRYSHAQLIPINQYDSFCRSVDQLVDFATNAGSGCIVSGLTDTNGFFILDGLELVNNKENNIFIICGFSGEGSPSYVYRYRKVISRYFGALISQKSFVHEYQGEVWHNTTPSYFSPSASITGYVEVIGTGQIQDVMPCYSYFSRGIITDVAYYGYCFNNIDSVEYDVQEWAQAGPTGYIWVDLQDNNISYLLAFAVTKATLIPRNKGTEKEPRYNVSLCGSNASNVSEIRVELTIVETNRKEIPPGAVLLKYEKNGEVFPKQFFNKDWQLDVEYSYLQLSTMAAGNTFWPNFTENGIVRFAESPYQVEFDSSSGNFIIPSVGGYTNEATISVMALVVDPFENRLQAVAVSKMILLGHKLACRNVDIYYAYKGQAKGFDLEPSIGFNIWRGAPTAIPSTSEGLAHYRRARCGDHECNFENCVGPMWFPFNNCTSLDFYNFLCGAGQCTMPISEGEETINSMGSAGWRYCMADEYNAWVTDGGNWAATCGTAFSYHYSVVDIAAGGMQFDGWTKKKGKVDEFEYKFNNWTLPPFGNTGRALVDRWLLRDFVSFYDGSGTGPIVASEYMPLVIDREDLIDDLDAFKFSGLSSDPNLSEPFSHRSVLSNLLANWIGETYIPDSRYRFEDIISLEYHGNCMYPWPVTSSSFGSRVIRYIFKDENIAWAWPEYWKNLERATDSSGFLSFLKLIRPEYYFDLDKNRHRFIIDEGYHNIYFSPPKIEEQNNDSDEESDSPSTLAGISIDGINYRFFEIVYGDYSTGDVNWNDESVSGEGGGSGGSGTEDNQGNIYEVANNGQNNNGFTVNNDIQWVHDFDTLFGVDASSEPEEDRKVFLGIDSLTGEDLYGYYNRGLIAKIPKSRLNRLPMSESDISSELQLVLGDFPSSESVDSPLVFVCYPENSASPTKIVLEGVWGAIDNEETLINLCKPAVSFRESRGEDISVVYSQTGLSGEIFSQNLTRYENYTITINMNSYPNRILFPPSYYDLTLTPLSNEYMNITSIKLYGSTYVPAGEKIRVWEQKFKISTLNLEDKANADGPDSNLYRSYDRNNKNGGQYFPTENYEVWGDGGVGSAASKAVMVSAKKFYGVGEDEFIPTNLDNIKEVEIDPQKELYEEAFVLDNYDEISLSPITPPDVEYFLTKVLLVDNIKTTGCTLKNYKVGWPNNPYLARFTQDGEFFAPGGHYFKWSDKYFKARCYVFGPVQTVYEAALVHSRHGFGDGEDIQQVTNDVAASYAGFGRLEYYEGRFWSLRSMGISEANQPTDALTGAKNGVYVRS